MTDQPEFEELEQIPWAALAAKPADPRARYAAIAVGVVIVIGVLAWITMRQGDSPPALISAETTAPASAPLPPTAVTVAAPTTAAPAATAVYSEADLMLIDVEEEKRLATMHAEWLVRDYLTMDGDPDVAARVAALLPDVERSGSSSYVEWVETFAVDSAEPGQYRVEVVYRVLLGGEEGFVREPAGALAVSLAIDVDGSAKLLAAPQPTAVPALDGLAPGP